MQQQEDEEVLVPHADLPANNHQPMEGSSRASFDRWVKNWLEDFRFCVCLHF